jgi:lipopolysaccharide transport system permease protein
MVLWQVFSEAVLGPVQAVTEAKHMLAKVNFPREAIVVAKIWEVLFSFLVKMLLVVGLFAWFRLPVSLSAVFAPIGVLTLVLVGVAFGVLVAPLAALYHDFSKGLTVILGGWLFLTPVVYPLPETNGLVSKLIYANPVTAPLVTTRDWITGYFPVMLTEYWIVAGCALIMLSVTWVIFRLAMPYVLERLTS